MTKTAQEVIAEQEVHGVAIAYRAGGILKALDRAGFVVVSKAAAEKAEIAVAEIVTTAGEDELWRLIKAAFPA